MSIVLDITLKELNETNLHRLADSFEQSLTNNAISLTHLHVFYFNNVIVASVCYRTQHIYPFGEQYLIVYYANRILIWHIDTVDIYNTRGKFNLDVLQDQVKFNVMLEHSTKLELDHRYIREYFPINIKSANKSLVV